MLTVVLVEEWDALEDFGRPKRVEESDPEQDPWPNKNQQCPRMAAQLGELRESRGVEAVDERRSLGGVLLEEGGFVPPKPGVFPPLPRPKVGAKREQGDVEEEVEARGVEGDAGEVGGGVGYGY